MRLQPVNDSNTGAVTAGQVSRFVVGVFGVRKLLENVPVGVVARDTLVCRVPRFVAPGAQRGALLLRPLRFVRCCVGASCRGIALAATEAIVVLVGGAPMIVSTFTSAAVVAAPLCAVAGTLILLT